jgi:hypothetical protein
MTCGTQAHAGTIRGTNVVVQADGASGLSRSVTFKFQRPLSRIFDLNDSSLFYYVEGPPQGQAALEYIVGPKGGPSLACDCTPTNVVLSVTPGQCDGQSKTYTLKNAMGSGLQGSVSSENFVFQMSLSYEFTDLSAS